MPGDVLEILDRHGVDLVLAGHRHVPYTWQVNGTLIVTSGTACTWRTRGETPHEPLTVTHGVADKPAIRSTKRPSAPGGIMTRFMWTSNLETGEQAIDGQHRELFRLANELDEVLESGESDEDVRIAEHLGLPRPE